MLFLDEADDRAGVCAQWKDNALCCTCTDKKLRHGNGDLRQQTYVNKSLS